MVRIELRHRLPQSVKLQNSNRFLIQGWIFASARLESLSVDVGTRSFEAEETEMLTPSVWRDQAHMDSGFFSMFAGFSVPVIIEPVVVPEERRVVLRARFKNGELFRHDMGTLSIGPWQRPDREFPLPAGVTGQNLLVICMASYNPKSPQFRRQVDSIIAQDFRNWICLVSDDHSTEACRRYMREIIAQDPRFFLVEQSQRVGFYHNFERCLELVPPTAKYVALSDQDDRWYPIKLSECLRKLVGPTQLVYSDMRIVHEDGAVISDTYWTNRKNYYRTADIDLLTLANTVTGAASVFKAELLRKALPFPPRYGAVYHDHWLAVIAAASGGIHYVDMPLYDYMQHGENVIGHADFRREAIIKVLIKRLIARFRSIAYASAPRLRLFVLHVVWVLYHLYEFQYAANYITTIAQTASLRLIDQEAIRRIRRPTKIPGLLAMHLKVLTQGATTNDIELKLIASRIISVGYKAAIPVLHRGVAAIWKWREHRLARGQQDAVSELQPNARDGSDPPPPNDTK